MTLTSDSPASVVASRNLSLTLGQGGGDTPVEPTGDPVITSVLDNGDGTLTIQGSNFGSKTQAAPRLVDYVATAYENGVANTTGGSWTTGQTMPIGSSGDAGAVWESATTTMQISDSRPMRHAGLSRLYTGAYRAWIGKPKAYSSAGGTLPTGKKPLFASWWMRQSYPALSLIGIVPEVAPTGTFIKDEVITCNGFTGVYAGSYVDGVDTMHSLHFDQRNLISNYRGFTVFGQSSGAEMVFPDFARGGSGSGFFDAGTKYARIWDEPGGVTDGGIRASIASHDHYISLVNSSGSNTRLVDNNSPEAFISVVRDAWFHMEAEVDLISGLYKIYKDSQLLGLSYTFDPTGVGLESYSPTPTLIGNDGGPSGNQETDISEIYVDEGLARVYAANAATWSSVTHRELQPPSSWSPTSIGAAKYSGALSGTAWVYVVSPDGSVNDQGYEVQL